MRALLFVSVLALIAGCDFLSTSSFSATFAAGEVEGVATLRVTNTGTVALAFDPLPCSAGLETLAGGEWTGVDYALALCTDGETRLAPGATDVAAYPLTVPDGAYRFRLPIRRADGGGDRTLFSNQFQVGDTDAP